MCTEVVVRLSEFEAEAETVGDLALLLGVPVSDVDPKATPEDCLCNADLEKLGARRATMQEGYPHPAYIIEWPIDTGPR